MDGWPLGQLQGFRGTSGDNEIVLPVDKSDVPWEVISAGTMLVIIPTMVVFVVLQRFFYSSCTQGTTK